MCDVISFIIPTWCVRVDTLGHPQREQIRTGAPPPYLFAGRLWPGAWRCGAVAPGTVV